MYLDTRTRLCIRICTLGMVLGLSAMDVMADRSIALPHEEHFNSKTWLADLPWATQGGTVTWVENGGWRGSGAAKITPPTAGQGYSGIGSFIGFGQQKRLNVRFLVWFGATFPEKSPGGKWIIMNRTAGRAQGVYRPMLFDNGNRANRHPTGQLQRWWYPCLQTLCTMHSKNDRFDQPFFVSSTKRIEEWVSFEFEADLEKSKINLYIHTQDGKVRGLYASHDMRQQEPGRPEDYPIIMIQGLGFFWNRADENAPVAERDDNTHIKIDEVRIDTSYIGPPVDFVSTGR